VDFNQPLLWYRINLVPPSGHPWAGVDWDKMSAIFETDFDRIHRADTSRLELYAAGRKALATNSAGERLRPEAVEEVENRYDKLLSNVTRLHREITGHPAGHFSREEGRVGGCTAWRQPFFECGLVLRSAAQACWPATPSSSWG
jgi:hypothetical protein